MPMAACLFHSLCQRPSARSRIVLQRPSARSRIVLPQASICEVADSACGLTLCDCQIHAALIVGSLLIIFFACRWLQVGSRNEPTWRRRGGDIDRLRNFDDQAELRAWYVETNPLLVCMFLFLCLRPVVRSPLVSAVWHCVIAKSMLLWLLFYSHRHIPTKWMPLHVCLFLFLCRRPVVRSPLVPPRRPVVRSPQVSAAAVWHCVIAISMRLWL